MGKDLRGRELGKGISQRKDGLYSGRYTDRFGKRQNLYSHNLSELRKNLKEARNADVRMKNMSQNYTVEEWYNIWMETYKIPNCRINTILIIRKIFSYHDGVKLE